MKIKATCSCCWKEKSYDMNPEEQKTLEQYRKYGRSMGMLQTLFPNIPAWIRSGAIDEMSGGFCICPECEEE